MGIRERKSRRSILLGQDNNALVLLIAINLLMFVFINFIKISYYLGNFPEVDFNNNFLHWFVFPASGNSLLTRPWTILTFMFSHDDVWALISTLLWLWGFGFILQSLLGNKHLAPLYIYGGAIGAVVFFTTMQLIPVLRNNAPELWLTGGGASIMAIALAATTLAPNYRIFSMLHGGIPLWILTMIFVILDYAMIASSSAGYGLAHLAGASIGFLYMQQVKNGHDWGKWMHGLVKWVLRLFQPHDKTAENEQLKREVFYNTGNQLPFQKTLKVNQLRIDELLDKINQKGYQSLSEDEKKYLKRASKEEL